MEGGKVYEEMGCFDSNTALEVTAESCFSQSGPPPQPPQVIITGSTSNSNCSVEELSEFHLSPQDSAPVNTAAMQFQINPSCEQFQNNNMNLMHQTVHDSSHHTLPSYTQPLQADWDGCYQDFINLGPNSTTPDLLSLLHLPRCSLPPSMLPNSSISFPNSTLSDIMSSSAVMYDPLFHLNFPLQPRDDQNQQVFQHNQRNESSSLLGVEDQIEANGGENLMFYQGNNHMQFENGILEYNNGLKRKGRGSGKTRIFPTERERRVHFNARYIDLKKLIPSPTKNDRASTVGDAIEYIKELLRTIEEFKMLVEKKRRGKQRRSKRARTAAEEEEEEEEDTVTYRPQREVDESSFNKKNNSLRCSWLKRKSKVTEVDVRIIDDEVTIKLVQKKKINCLLFTTKVLDQLQLDLHHVAGGQIGEHYSFLFNTKISEGSCVYASGIADTVMEVVEKQYMEALPNNGYYY